MCVSSDSVILIEGNKCVTRWSVSELIKLEIFWCIISCIWIESVGVSSFSQLSYNEYTKNKLYLFGFLGLDGACPWKYCSKTDETQK